MTAPRLSVPDSSIPLATGRYRHILDLGRGGMADIVLAVLQGPGGFNKLQVVKLLRKEFSSDRDFCTMFLDEAKLAARINHANVVQTNEVGFDGERYFIAMEYLEGQNLDRFTKGAAAAEGMPLAVMLRILCDVCKGLHFAHELKDFDGSSLRVVHRDISPQNIFVTYDGTTKIVDFGIAKASDSNTETQAGTFKGKVAYMAPEQLTARNDVDRRADIFSVGTVLWRAVTGKRMWHGLAEVEILHRLVGHDIPEPIALEGIPDRLVAICRRATAGRVEDRYATAAELGTDLEDVLDGLPQENSDVGALITKLFSAHAQEVRDAIDVCLTSGISMVAPMKLPSLPLTSYSTVMPLGASRRGVAPPADRVSLSTERTSRRLFAASGAILGLAATLVLGGRVLGVSSFRGVDIHHATAANVNSVAKRSPAATRVTVRVDTQPSRAVVEWDGRAIGYTPLSVDLPPGTQTIVISKDGYDNETLNLDVPAEATDPIQRSLSLHPKLASPSANADPTIRRARPVVASPPAASPPAGKSPPASASPSPAEPPQAAAPAKPKVKIVEDGKITVITD